MRKPREVLAEVFKRGEKMAQRLNLELIRLAWSLRWKRHTHLEIGKAIKRSSRQVRNYLDEKWLAERGIGYLKYGGKQIGVPAGFLENQAWGQCQNADHSWMDDARFDGHAYIVKDVNVPTTSDWGSRLINIREVRTCRYCGDEAKPEKRRGFIIV